MGFWSLFPCLGIENHLLVKRYDSGSRIVLPKILIPNNLQLVHDSPSGAHFGLTKVPTKVKAKFFWIGMKKDCLSWINSCDVCQKRKAPTKKFRYEFKEWTPSHRFEHVSADILGPLPISDGFIYILVIGDNFTR